MGLKLAIGWIILLIVTVIAYWVYQSGWLEPLVSFGIIIGFFITVLAIVEIAAYSVYKGSNGLSLTWARYVLELLSELQTHCDHQIHKDQYDDINTYIETGS